MSSENIEPRTPVPAAGSNEPKTDTPAAHLDASAPAPLVKPNKEDADKYEREPMPGVVPFGRLNHMAGERANVWAVRASGEGYPDQTFIGRGPEAAAIVQQHFQWMLNAQSQRAIENGMPDPKFRVASVTPIGRHAGDLGTFAPPSTEPINLNRFAAPTDHSLPGNVEPATVSASREPQRSRPANVRKSE